MSSINTNDDPTAAPQPSITSTFRSRASRKTMASGSIVAAIVSGIVVHALNATADTLETWAKRIRSALDEPLSKIV